METENINNYKEWIPVVAAFAGGFLAVIGGLIAGFFNRSNLKLQLDYQAKLESKKIKLSKLEELSTTTTNFIINIIFVQSKIVEMSFAKEVKPEELIELQEKFYGNLSKIAALLNLHATEFKTEADEFVKTSGEFFNYGMECVKNKSIDLDDLQTRSEKLTKVAGQLIDKNSAAILSYLN